MPSLDVIKIFARVDTALSLLALIVLASVILYRRRDPQRSLRKIIGVGYSLDAEGVLEIIKQFEDEEIRMTVLRDVLDYHQSMSEAVLKKIAHIDIEQLQRQRAGVALWWAGIVATVFLCVGILALLYREPQKAVLSRLMYPPSKPPRRGLWR